MTAIFILFHILGLASSVHAILQTRTPQGAIAWVVSLNTLPIVSVPAYWVFGRSKFNGYVSTHQDMSIEIQDKVKQISKKIQPYLLDDLSHSTELVDYRLENQSLWERFKARGSALLAPVL